VLDFAPRFGLIFRCGANELVAQLLDLGAVLFRRFFEIFALALGFRC
jgi:hypothetical protein